MPGSSVAERFETLGQGQLQQPNLGPACLDSDQKKHSFKQRFWLLRLLTCKSLKLFTLNFESSWG